MDIEKIKAAILFLVTILNLLAAYLVWRRGRNKATFHLGWCFFFSALFCFSWVGVYFFNNHKLLWSRAHWIAGFLGAYYLIFVYYFTNHTKYIKLKIAFWNVLGFAIFWLSMTTPYFFKSVISNYPYLSAESAGILNVPLGRGFTILVSILTLYYLIKSYRQESGFKKWQIKYFIWGMSLSVTVAFILSGLWPFLSPNYNPVVNEISAYGTAILVLFTTYAIFKNNLFNIKLILTELLTTAIGLILFTQIFFTESPLAKIVASVIFILFCFIGYLLIRATHQELKKEREAEKLAAELNSLNKTLEKKVREKTFELQTSIVELEKSKKALLNILDDIEEARHRIEEEKNKTLAIIANFADGLLVFDNRGLLTLINPQAETFFAIKSGPVIGKSLEGLKEFPSLGPLLFLLQDKSVPIFRKELSLNDLTLEVSVIAINNQKEKIGDLVILHNVTREKLIERMKTEFVSVAAHQLRTPLSGVKWALSLLLDGDIGKLNAEQKSFLQKSFDSNERMLVLINDLLDVARIEEGKYVFNLAPAKIEELTKKAMETFKELAKRRKIKVTYIPPASPLPTINVDAEKITMAMQNLIENAVKYTPSGGQVTISLKHDTNKIEFSVKDTGVGVSKAQQDRLFTKFFRAANVMLMETDGTGLGLFITKNIITAHNGQIQFESKEGQGSTFSFSLPIGH